MAWLREPLASRLRRVAWRLPDLRLLLSQRFAALDQLGAVRFGARSRGTQWLALVALSVVLIAILEALKLPGGIMWLTGIDSPLSGSAIRQTARSTCWRS